MVSSQRPVNQMRSLVRLDYSPSFVLVSLRKRGRWLAF